MEEKPAETGAPLTTRLRRRLLAYSSVGFASFLLDLTIIALLHSWLGIASTVAVTVGFAVGITTNYLLCYLWVYRGTKRDFKIGLAIFLVLAIIGMIGINLSVSWLTANYALPLLIARTLVAAVVGLINFTLNTFFNFKLL